MGSEGSDQVRLRIEMTLVVTDPGRLRKAVRERPLADDLAPEAERARTAERVGRDLPEAIAYLVDPLSLTQRLPGVSRVRATWGSDLVEDVMHDDHPADEDQGGRRLGQWRPPGRLRPR